MPKRPKEGSPQETDQLSSRLDKIIARVTTELKEEEKSISAVLKEVLDLEPVRRAVREILKQPEPPDNINTLVRIELAEEKEEAYLREIAKELGSVEWIEDIHNLLFMTNIDGGDPEGELTKAFAAVGPQDPPYHFTKEQFFAAVERCFKKVNEEYTIVSQGMKDTDERKRKILTALKNKVAFYKRFFVETN